MGKGFPGWRTEGTDHLVAAARAVGARRFVGESFAGWPYARDGGTVKTEADPVDSHPPAALRQSLDAIRYLERPCYRRGDRRAGIALRDLLFAGRGRSVPGRRPPSTRPHVGRGPGVWSFVHIDDAAAATVAAIERGAPGVYNIVDDEPAPVSEWLPVLAAAVGAKPPQHIPAFLDRVGIGEHGVALMTQIRGASNRKAKRELGWRPRYLTWRTGFREALGLEGT